MTTPKHQQTTMSQGSNSFAPWDDPRQKPLIQFRNVSKYFGAVPAVRDVNIDIFEREFFALLGPSGCGKTTLMRMLAGFETPSSGKILLDGKDLASIPANKRPVNMMFQSYALFPHLTIWDNIAFGLRREGKPRDVIAARVDEMLRLTQLSKLAKRKPHQVSGGQRQRIALARALAKAPKLLLLDEPLGALDRKLREQTQFELMDIQEKTGTTFIIVTHDQEEAMTVASRVAVMNEGAMAQIATPENIYELPNSRYVAGFIGDVSFIEGKAIPQDGQIHITWAEGQKPIIAQTDQYLGVGQDVAFAIRPEKVTILKERPRGMTNIMKGKVLDIAYLGNLSTYHVALPSGHILKAQVTNQQRYARNKLTWEDDVWVGFNAASGVVLTE